MAGHTPTSKREPTAAGQRYGRLVAVRFDHVDHRRYHCWLWQCDCGKTTIVAASTVRGGNTRSCGCLMRETSANTLRTLKTTHGMSKSSEFRIWGLMLHRCTNPNSSAWPRYGGRGITVSERWMRFETFYADMGPRPSPGHSLDRINNDLGYEPSNVRWATRQEQGRNKRNTYMVTLNGKQMSLSEAAQEAGLSHSTVYSRVTRGWSVDRALSTPLTAQHRRTSRSSSSPSK
jgi:hypothetical protein